MCDNSDKYTGCYDRERIPLTSNIIHEVIRPRFLSEVSDVNKIWSLLHKVDARDQLLLDWIKHLPAGYELILDKEVLRWLWDAEVDIIPDALKSESRGALSELYAGSSLHCMVACRSRANELGIESMDEYVKLFRVKIKKDIAFTDDDDYFSLVKPGKGVFAMEYSPEDEIICKEVVIDCDEWYSYDSCRTPIELRYALIGWSNGDNDECEDEDEVILRYATNLVLYLRTKMDCLQSLDTLSCYSDTIQWTPGTVVVPNDLREEIDSMMTCLPPCRNSTFLLNYYSKNSDNILRSLHDIIARKVMRRRRYENKCIVQ